MCMSHMKTHRIITDKWMVKKLNDKQKQFPHFYSPVLTKVYHQISQVNNESMQRKRNHCSTHCNYESVFKSNIWVDEIIVDLNEDSQISLIWANFVDDHHLSAQLWCWHLLPQYLIICKSILKNNHLYLNEI